MNKSTPGNGQNFKDFLETIKTARRGDLYFRLYIAAGPDYMKVAAYQFIWKQTAETQDFTMASINGVPVNFRRMYDAKVVSYFAVEDNGVVEYHVKVRFEA